MNFKTTHEAYLQALQDVWFFPEFKAAPRGLPVREILNYTFKVLEPTADPIVTLDPERNKIIAAYTTKECELYDSCSNSVDDFAAASKFWQQLANPDGTVNSAYGYLIWKNKSHGNSLFESGWPKRFYAGIKDVDYSTLLYPQFDFDHKEHMRTPWEFAKQTLEKDKDSRQAVLRFGLPEHAWMGNKDFPCTMHGLFIIRDDKLHLTINMRSNDLMKGLVYDLPWFVGLMDKMIAELKQTYPSLTKGSYTHFVHSLHIYEKDEKAILKMLGRM